MRYLTIWLIAVLLYLTPVAEARPASESCVTPSCKKQAKRWRHARARYLKARAAFHRELSYDRLRLNATRPYRGWLAATRACESGGNYATSTGNGFYGAYQFTISSWASVGGAGMPNLAEPLEQDYRAVRLLHSQGAGAWPVCGA